MEKSIVLVSRKRNTGKEDEGENPGGMCTKATTVLGGRGGGQVGER